MASGDTLLIFHPYDNEPPASGYATLDTRNAHPCLDFDASAAETAQFSFILPRNYAGGGVTIYLHIGASGITTGDFLIDTSFERISSEQQDVDGDGFATAVSWSAQTVPGTDGNVKIYSNAHTDGAQMDSLAVGEMGRLKITRAAIGGGDTAAADIELYAVEIKET